MSLLLGHSCLRAFAPAPARSECPPQTPAQPTPPLPPLGDCAPPGLSLYNRLPLKCHKYHLLITLWSQLTPHLLLEALLDYSDYTCIPLHRDPLSFPSVARGALKCFCTVTSLFSVFYQEMQIHGSRKLAYSFFFFWHPAHSQNSIQMCYRTECFFTLVGHVDVIMFLLLLWPPGSSRYLARLWPHSYAGTSEFSSCP